MTCHDRLYTRSFPRPRNAVMATVITGHDRSFAVMHAVMDGQVMGAFSINDHGRAHDRSWAVMHSVTVMVGHAGGHGRHAATANHHRLVVYDDLCTVVLDRVRDRSWLVCDRISRPWVKYVPSAKPWCNPWLSVWNETWTKPWTTPQSVQQPLC